MGNLVKKNDTVLAINIQKVKDKIAIIRNLEVIADADVAELYGVETKRINEAVKNNPDKFPASYMFVLNKSEVLELRSKISTTNVSAMNRNPTKVSPYLIQISYLLENQRGFSKRGDSPTTIPQQFQLL